jgi:diaminopimelate epimerase
VSESRSSVTVALSKHHGLGNDFLVVFADELPAEVVAHQPSLAAFAVLVCDRRRGVGADGLLVAEPGEPDVGRGFPATDARMSLYNADGSRAEMSGNGIRCFVQAVAQRDDPDGEQRSWRIATDAGVRVVEVEPTGDRTIVASVDMGLVGVGLPPVGWADVGCHPDRPVAHLSTGNPHTVVGVDDVDIVDLAVLGGKVPDTNLEIVAPTDDPATVRMRVHERGAGITEACGTGACASAWAARSWGLVPAGVPEITVVMDGGSARVRLDQPAPGHATLVGPAVHVADVTVPSPVPIR